MSKLVEVSHSILSAEALVSRVLAQYDLGPEIRCGLFHHGMNDTYTVDTPSPRYVLRVSRCGWRSVPEIQSELDVLLHLDAHGTSVSAPVRKQDGGFLTTLPAPEGPRHCVLFHRAPGGRLDFEPDEVGVSLLFGRKAAELHGAMDSFRPVLAREKLDLEYLLDGPLRAIRPILAIRPGDLERLEGWAGKLRREAGRLPLQDLESGLCHGDLHGGNAHIDENQRLTLFDFDCCGLGWRAHDLAVYRWSALVDRKEDEQWPAFLKGYQQVRRIRDLDLRAIPFFVALRFYWLLGLFAQNASTMGSGVLNEDCLGLVMRFLENWEAGSAASA